MDEHPDRDAGAEEQPEPEAPQSDEPSWDESSITSEDDIRRDTWNRERERELKRSIG